jgi:hypothetical protein
MFGWELVRQGLDWHCAQCNGAGAHGKKLDYWITGLMDEGMGGFFQ